MSEKGTAKRTGEARKNPTKKQKFTVYESLLVTDEAKFCRALDAIKIELVRQKHNIRLFAVVFPEELAYVEDLSRLLHKTMSSLHMHRVTNESAFNIHQVMFERYDAVFKAKVGCSIREHVSEWVRQINLFQRAPDWENGLCICVSATHHRRLTDDHTPDRTDPLPVGFDTRKNEQGVTVHGVHKVFRCTNRDTFGFTPLVEFGLSVLGYDATKPHITAYTPYTS